MALQWNIHRAPDAQTVLLLAVLEDKDKTGWQIVRELECRGDSTFAMQEGTVYIALHRLEEQGEIWSYERSMDDRPRRYYRLTRQGVRTLHRVKQSNGITNRKMAGGGAYVSK